MARAKDPVTLAQRLTEQLNEDPKFRLAFAKNPRAALKRLGIEVTEEEAEEARECLTIALLEAAVACGGVVPFYFPRPK